MPPSRPQNLSLIPSDRIAADEEMVQPEWSSELQKLYNQMRDAELGLDLGDKIRLRGDRSGKGGDNEHLQPPPPTPSQVTAMSRSTSKTSASSLAEKFGEAVIDDGVGNPGIFHTTPLSGRRRRARRRGPLSQASKARTAFIRKLRACSRCRARRVKCGHHDLREFGRQYRALRDSPNGTGTSHNDPVQPPPPHHQPADGVEADQTSLLVGVGGRIESSTPSPESESDPLASLLANDSVWDMDALMAPFGQAGAATSFVASEDQPVPIGKCVNSLWQCQFGNDPVFDILFHGNVQPCPSLFSTPEDLQQHFRQHCEYRKMSDPWFWRCSGCGLLVLPRLIGSSDNPCTELDCAATGNRFEYCYYGNLVSRTYHGRTYGGIAVTGSQTDSLTSSSLGTGWENYTPQSNSTRGHSLSEFPGYTMGGFLQLHQMGVLGSLLDCEKNLPGRQPDRCFSPCLAPSSAWPHITTRSCPLRGSSSFRPYLCPHASLFIAKRCVSALAVVSLLALTLVGGRWVEHTGPGLDNMTRLVMEHLGKHAVEYCLLFLAGTTVLAGVLSQIGSRLYRAQEVDTF